MFHLQIKEFLNCVCEQIKYKPICHQISEEMENHLKESKESFMAQGLTEQEAEEQAIKQMGNAEEIGKNLNQIHRPKLDWKLLMITAVLLFFGALVSFTRSQVLDLGGSIERYGVGLLIGGVLAIGFYFVDYRKLLKKPEILYGVVILLMIFVQNFGLGINGRRVYLSFFGFTLFTPALVVFINILAFIGFLQKIDRTKNCTINFSENRQIKMNLELLKIILLSGISLSLLLPLSIPLTIILGLIYLILATVKIGKSKYLIALWGVPALVGIMVIALISPMFFDRFLNSVNPERDPAGGGWIGINQSLILESARLFGPAEDMSGALDMFDEGTNFAFISILAHYGWIPTLAMVSAIAIFSIKLLMNAVKIKDMDGKLLIVAISSLFILQSMFNLLMNLNLGIKSNVNMPFVSYGNMDLIINLAYLALSLGVYRRKDILKMSKPEKI